MPRLTNVDLFVHLYRAALLVQPEGVCGCHECKIEAINALIFQGPKYVYAEQRAMLKMGIA